MEKPLSPLLDFAEFKSSTKIDWQAKADKDLGGTSLEKLKWYPFSDDLQTSLEPYYSIEDLTDLGYLQGFHNSINNHSGWHNYVKINNQDPNFRSISQSTIDSGNSRIIVDITDLSIFEEQAKWMAGNDINYSLKVDSVENVLNKIDLTGSKIHCILSSVTPQISSISDLRRQNVSSRFICINSNENNIDQQLSEILFKLNRLISDAIEDHLDIAGLMKHVVLHLRTGPEFFLEIAKLRAVRILIEALLTAYIPGHSSKDNENGVDLLCESEVYRNDVYEPHGNMIKGTYAAMASVIGGCDGVIMVSENETEQTQNVAIQVSNILKEEAYLDKVSDPASGSYFIENLTHKLVLNTWNKFVQSQSSNV